MMSKISRTFLQKIEVFSPFPCKKRSDRRLRSEKFLFRPRKADFVQLRVDQNDVFADALDALPRNDIVVTSPRHTEKLARPRHDDRRDPSRFEVHLHVRNKAQPRAVADIDDLPALQAGKPLAHTLTRLFSKAYAPRGRLMTRRSPCGCWRSRFFPAGTPAPARFPPRRRPPSAFSHRKSAAQGCAFRAHPAWR